MNLVAENKFHMKDGKEMLFSCHIFAMLRLYVINNSIALLYMDVQFRTLKILIQYIHNKNTALMMSLGIQANFLLDYTASDMEIV